MVQWPEFDEIRCSVEAGILTLVLDRPGKLNAMTRRMGKELISALDLADADDDVRAIVVTGAGRGFCAGADLSGGADTFDYAARGDGEGAGASPVRADGSIDYAHAAVRDVGGLVTLRLYDCLKPVIGAVNGPAVGFGATFILPMDIRLASTDARFGYVFSRRGIVPESAAAFFLPRVVGIDTALEWCMTGRVFEAQEAQAAGLVRSIHAPEELLPKARALAHEIAAGSAPVSIALTRQMLWRGLGMQHPMDAHRIDSRAVYVRGRGADAREGVTSFLEKRPPVFPERVSRDMPDFFPWWQEPGDE